MTARPPPSFSLQRLPARVVALAVFGVRFLHALVVSNIQMAIVVLSRPTRDLAPGFIEYPLEGLSGFEVLLLSHCITLTPGTTSVEVSDDGRTLVIHALDARDPVQARASIKQLEGPLLAWTR